MSALLPLEEAELFFRLHRALMFHVNEKCKIIPDNQSPDEFSALPPEFRVEVREEFVEQPDLVESFVADNPARLSDEELQIVRSWRHRVSGHFFIFRNLKKHTVFLNDEDSPIAYGVLALSEPFEDVVGLPLPVWVKTLLLPFRDKIVYDGHMNAYNITFGGGVKRNLNEKYKQAKAERGGVVTSLPT